MASITISIPDLNAPEILDAFAWKYKYDKRKIINETKGEFAKRVLARDVKQTLAEYKRHLAHGVSDQEVGDEMDSININ